MRRRRARWKASGGGWRKTGRRRERSSRLASDGYPGAVALSESYRPRGSTWARSMSPSPTGLAS